MKPPGGPGVSYPSPEEFPTPIYVQYHRPWGVLAVSRAAHDVGLRAMHRPLEEVATKLSPMATRINEIDPEDVAWATNICGPVNLLVGLPEDEQRMDAAPKALVRGWTNATFTHLNEESLARGHEPTVQVMTHILATSIQEMLTKRVADRYALRNLVRYAKIVGYGGSGILGVTAAWEGAQGDYGNAAVTVGAAAALCKLTWRVCRPFGTARTKHAEIRDAAGLIGSLVASDFARLYQRQPGSPFN